MQFTERELYVLSVIIGKADFPNTKAGIAAYMEAIELKSRIDRYIDKIKRESTVTA